MKLISSFQECIINVYYSNRWCHQADTDKSLLKRRNILGFVARHSENRRRKVGERDERNDEGKDEEERERKNTVKIG